MTEHRNSDGRPDMRDWEAQVNDLLDGELGDSEAELLKSAAEQDQELARAIIEAYQLQRMLAAIPQERAPASLRKRLRSVPREQKKLERPALLQPRWAGAMVMAALVAFVAIQTLGPREPSDAEIAQARADLAVAFSYVAKTTGAAGRQMRSSVDHGIAEPVSETTVRTLNDQFELNEEQEA